MVWIIMSGIASKMHLGRIKSRLILKKSQSSPKWEDILQVTDSASIYQILFMYKAWCRAKIVVNADLIFGNASHSHESQGDFYVG